MEKVSNLLWTHRASPLNLVIPLGVSKLRTLLSEP